MLCLDPSFDADIPVTVTAIGERTLEWAGGVADAVVLHTFFTDETLARSVAAVRRGAERAGRDPASVRIWSVLATVGDHLDEELRLKKLVGRLATYLQGYGDLMVGVNDWDPEVLARFRADEFVAGFGAAFDAKGTHRGPGEGRRAAPRRVAGRRGDGYRCGVRRRACAASSTWARTA